MAELVEAVRERMNLAIETPVGGFEARVMQNVLAIVERELALGPQTEAFRVEVLANYGAADEEALAASIREGQHDDCAGELRRELLQLAQQQLRIDNPRW